MSSPGLSPATDGEPETDQALRYGVPGEVDDAGGAQGVGVTDRGVPGDRTPLVDVEAQKS
jgi:hypothetical protein